MFGATTWMTQESMHQSSHWQQQWNLTALIAEMGRTGWALHMKATFYSFDTIRTIGTTLSIFQNPLQGYSIMLSRNRIVDNPWIFRFAILLLFVGRSNVSSTELECPLKFADFSMFLSTDAKFNALETQFAPSLVATLAKDKGIFGIFG